jgi:hypothetical protein
VQHPCFGGYQGGGVPLAGHTQLNHANPTAGAPRQSLTSEIRLTTLSQELPCAWTKIAYFGPGTGPAPVRVPAAWECNTCDRLTLSALVCIPAGYCGVTAGHCGTGCQTPFGSCSGSPQPPPVSSPAPPPTGNGAVSDYISATQFEQIFLHRNDAVCECHGCTKPALGSKGD